MYKVFLKEIHRVNWYCCEAYQLTDWLPWTVPSWRGQRLILHRNDIYSTHGFTFPVLRTSPPAPPSEDFTEWLTGPCGISHNIAADRFTTFYGKKKKCKNRKVTTISNCATLCHATLEPQYDGLQSIVYTLGQQLKHISASPTARTRGSRNLRWKYDSHTVIQSKPVSQGILLIPENLGSAE